MLITHCHNCSPIPSVRFLSKVYMQDFYKEHGGSLCSQLLKTCSAFLCFQYFRIGWKYLKIRRFCTKIQISLVKRSQTPGLGSFLVLVTWPQSSLRPFLFIFFILSQLCQYISTGPWTHVLLAAFAVEQCCPIELSAMVEMFSVCAVQYRSHSHTWLVSI